jgi:hypothetical protein
MQDKRIEFITFLLNVVQKVFTTLKGWVNILGGFQTKSSSTETVSYQRSIFTIQSPIHLLPDGPVLDPAVTSSYGTQVRLVPSSQQQIQIPKSSSSCIVQIRPLQQQQEHQQSPPCVVQIRSVQQQQQR